MIYVVFSFFFASSKILAVKKMLFCSGPCTYTLEKEGELTRIAFRTYFASEVEKSIAPGTLLLY